MVITMKHKEVKFKKVDEKYLDEIFLLLQQLTKIDYSNRSKIDCWNKFTSNNSNNGVVGIYKNRVIAYGNIVIENKIRGELAGHIEDIVVDKKMRRKNIGIKLINKLVKIGKKKGCYRVTLTCDNSLVNFYEKNEFKVNDIAMKRFINYEF